MCTSLVIEPNRSEPTLPPLLQELSNSIWGAATLRWPLPSTLLQRFEDTSLDLLDQFNTQNLSNTLWALAVMGHRCGPEWQFEYCKQMRGSVPHMHALQLCDVMWAMAQLRMAPPALLVDAALQRVAAELDSVSVRELAELLHALAVLRARPAAAWMTVIGDELLYLAAPASVLRTGSPAVSQPKASAGVRKQKKQPEEQQGGGDMDGGSEAGTGGMDSNRRPSEGVEREVYVLVKRSVVGGDKHVAESMSCLCRSMCALVKLGYRPSERWLARTMSVLQPHLPELHPNELPELILALSTLRYAPAPVWLAAYALRVETVGLGALQADQLVIILESLTALGFAGRDALMMRMSRAAQEQRL